MFCHTVNNSLLIDFYDLVVIVVASFFLCNCTLLIWWGGGETWSKSLLRPEACTYIWGSWFWSTCIVGSLSAPVLILGWVSQMSMLRQVMRHVILFSIYLVLISLFVNWDYFRDLSLLWITLVSVDNWEQFCQWVCSQNLSSFKLKSKIENFNQHHILLGFC